MLRIHHIVSFVRVHRKCALDLSFSYSHHRIVRNVLVRRIASIVNVSWTFLFLCIGLDWTSWISLFLIRRVVRLHRKCVWDLSFLSHRNVLIHRIRRGTFLFLAIATFLSFVSVVSFAFVVLIHRHMSFAFVVNVSGTFVFFFYAKLLSIVSSIVCRSPVVLFILLHFFSGCGGYMKTHFCDDAVSDIPWAFPFPHALFVCLFISIDCSSFPVSLRPSCPKKWFW